MKDAEMAEPRGSDMAGWEDLDEDLVVLLDKSADLLERDLMIQDLSDSIAAGDVPAALVGEVKRTFVAIASDPDDSPGVQWEAAHGLAYVWFREGDFERVVFQRLVPVARDVVKWLVAEERRDWW